MRCIECVMLVQFMDIGQALFECLKAVMLNLKKKLSGWISHIGSTTYLMAIQLSAIQPDICGCNIWLYIQLWLYTLPNFSGFQLTLQPDISGYLYRQICMAIQPKTFFEFLADNIIRYTWLYSQMYLAMQLSATKLHMSHLLLLGKFEYGGGPIFKVVLEC